MSDNALKNVAPGRPRDVAMKDFTTSLSRINVGCQVDTLTDNEKEQIKETISTFYSRNVSPRLSWNWGMYDGGIDREIRARIPGYDEHTSDGLSEQLYHFVLRSAGLATCEGARVLEVGCGTGKGLNFLSRLEPKAHFIGVDRSRYAIRFAQAQFARTDDSLNFFEADAEHLPFGDAEFDAVINIESSHNYPDLGRFYSEVTRVLKPGGLFSFADILTNDRALLVERCKAEATSLRWIKAQDISDLVKAAIRKRMAPHSHLRTSIRRNVPFPSRILVERAAMHVLGARFADCDVGVWGRLLLRGAPLAFQRYHHAVAVKQPS